MGSRRGRAHLCPALDSSILTEGHEMPLKPAKLFSWEAGEEELYLL